MSEIEVNDRNIRIAEELIEARDGGPGEYLQRKLSDLFPIFEGAYNLFEKTGVFPRPDDDPEDREEWLRNYHNATLLFIRFQAEMRALIEESDTRFAHDAHEKLKAAVTTN